MNPNNIRAEAHFDQMQAAARENETIEPHPLHMAAAARRVDVRKMPPSLRAACEPLLQLWAEETGVDRPGDED